MIDLTNVKSDAREILPEGIYLVSCADAEIKDTKAGNGEYINARFQVMEGPHKGTSIYTMFNLKNPNAKAVEIGLKQLKGFMEAAGATSFVLKDVTALCGMQALAVTKIKEDDYGVKAVISYFKPAPKNSQSLTNSVSGTNEKMINGSAIPF